MAKYTRERRRRALELHTWYGRCVADMIRELGHTSRDALRMWHRGWLEEQKTGLCQRGVMNCPFV